MGPMFRYERPQKGRYRQFHQIDAEALGFPGPGRRRRADPDDRADVAPARPARPASSTSIRSARRNRARSTARSWSSTSVSHRARARRRQPAPARRQPAAHPRQQEPGDGRASIAGAPSITDLLDPESAAHFATLCAQLDAAGVDFVVNPRLVRGLDYYSRTVFEWVTTDLGSQDAVCSGGRYDGLVAQLGGEPTPAIGWALGAGAHRRTDAAAAAGRATRAQPDVYLVLAGAAAEARASRSPRRLRDAAPGLRVETNCGGGSFKSQLKRADKSGARYAVIVGDDEAARGVAAVKALRGEARTARRRIRRAGAELREHAGRDGIIRQRAARRAGRWSGEVEDLSDNEREEQLRRFVGRELALDRRRHRARPRRARAGWQYWQKSQLQAAGAGRGCVPRGARLAAAGTARAGGAKADELRGLHPKSPYADQADLALARPPSTRANSTKPRKSPAHRRRRLARPAAATGRARGSRGC